MAGNESVLLIFYRSYTVFRYRLLSETDPHMQETLRSLADIIDDIIEITDSDDKAIESEYFMYSMASSNLVLRTIDTNRIDVIRPRRRRSRQRRKTGMESRRPLVA